MTTNIFSLLKNQKSVVLALWTAVVLLFAAPQGAMAETKEVVYYPQKQITWEEWQTWKGNNAYVTLTGTKPPTVGADGRLQVAGTEQGKAYKVTFTSPKNTYIGSYSYTGYQSGVGGTTNAYKCIAYFRENADATDGTGTFDIQNAGEKPRPELGSVDYTGQQSNTLFISVYNKQGRVAFSGNRTTIGAINNVVLNLLIPEVKTASSSPAQSAPTDTSWVDKTWAKNEEKSIEIVYDVQDALAKEDFSVAVSGTTGNKGTMTAVKSFDPLTQKLTVTVKYKTANSDDYAENFSGKVTVSSVNTVNDATYTTTISGTAGAVLSANNLRFNIESTQFVNTHYQVGEHTYANSNEKITYTSSNDSVAYFDADDQTLHIIRTGTTTLTATQPANPEYKAGSAVLTVNVSKRTANFVYTPSGNLYTSHNYPGYVTVDNDPKHSLPQLTFTSSDSAKFRVDANGEAHTYAVEAEDLTLTITADTAIEKSTNDIRWQDEWNAINVSRPVTIVKDPTTVTFCMSDAHNELDDEEFCRVSSSTGTVRWINDQLRVGSDADRDRAVVTAEFHFKGIPNQIQYSFTRPNEGIKEGALVNGDKTFTLKIRESHDGISWTDVPEASHTAASSNQTKGLKSDTRHIQIYYDGCVYAYFSSFCVTAATDCYAIDNLTEKNKISSLALETTASGTDDIC